MSNKIMIPLDGKKTNYKISLSNDMEYDCNDPTNKIFGIVRNITIWYPTGTLPPMVRYVYGDNIDHAVASDGFENALKDHIFPPNDIKYKCLVFPNAYATCLLGNRIEYLYLQGVLPDTQVFYTGDTVDNQFPSNTFISPLAGYVIGNNTDYIECGSNKYYYPTMERKLDISEDVLLQKVHIIQRILYPQITKTEFEGFQDHKICKIFKTELFDKFDLKSDDLINHDVFSIVGCNLGHSDEKKSPYHVAISGKKHHGKTTVVDLLLKYNDIPTVVLNFGEILKEICQVLFPNTPIHTYEKEEPQKTLDGRSVRDILIIVGDIIREFKIFNWFYIHKDYSPITNRIELEIFKYRNTNHSVIIGDVRFQDEYDMIKSHAFDNIKIVRPDYNGYTDSKHDSETLLDYFDYTHTIINDGKIKNLSSVVKKSKFKHRSFNTSTGKLDLVIGCMFAGKSTELMRLGRREIIAGNQTIMVKHVIDVRYDGSNNNIVTHDKNKIPAIAVSNLSQIYYMDDFSDIKVICIDEGQFFDNIVDVVLQLVNVYNKHVIISALSSTYTGEKFGDVLDLVAQADDVKKLKAICMVCKQDNAIFSYHSELSHQTVYSGDVIGGSDKYDARCRKCFNM